jgi:hypothetical protein
MTVDAHGPESSSNFTFHGHLMAKTLVRYGKWEMQYPRNIRPDGGNGDVVLDHHEGLENEGTELKGIYQIDTVYYVAHTHTKTLFGRISGTRVLI